MKTIRIVVLAILALTLVGGAAVFAATPEKPMSDRAGYPCPNCVGTQYGWYCISANWMRHDYNSQVGDINYFKPNCVWSHYADCTVNCVCAPAGYPDYCGNW